eukprot:TRINITY_DN71989_c0_g1_i1.p1 TRINITY_DN71989_c0_g1~~TRINITY_DN71989_c0_g1_i1.p1  ORF type:complete len:501 (+),score=87.92 TRINITY_DN71989_c0_g1_i1:145-1647(+)
MAARNKSPAPRNTPKVDRDQDESSEEVSYKKDIVRRPRPYEFGGNIGTGFWTFFIPACVFWAYGINVVNQGNPCLPTLDFWKELIFGLPDGVSLRPTLKGFQMITGWLLLQLAFQQFMPGRMQDGVLLKNGNRLPYKLNGWKSWCATWALVIGSVYGGLIDPTVLYRHLGSLMVWANIYSYAIALYLYIDFGLLWRRWVDSPEFEEDWGVFSLKDFFHDYWMGTARNPRIFHFLGYPVDLKFFFEARPGLILWVLVNYSNVAAMYYDCNVNKREVVCEPQGDFSRIPLAILIISLSHHYYIFDYFWHEEAILTTTDIRHEPFGFMLMWGDFGFLPWMYTNSFTRYIASVRPRYVGNQYLDVLCILLWIMAQALFRLTNIQKHNFRSYAAKNNNDLSEYKVWGKPVTYVKTREGSLMLTSGFWGMCRHPNYMPDMIMAFTWWLNCTAHDTFPLIPFGYVIYFWSMDIHRFFRDEQRCHEKYGEDWDAYVKAVPYCLIPGVW